MFFLKLLLVTVFGKQTAQKTHVVNSVNPKVQHRQAPKNKANEKCLLQCFSKTTMHYVYIWNCIPTINPTQNPTITQPYELITEINISPITYPNITSGVSCVFDDLKTNEFIIVVRGNRFSSRWNLNTNTFTHIPLYYAGGSNGKHYTIVNRKLYILADIILYSLNLDTDIFTTVKSNIGTALSDPCIAGNENNKLLYITGSSTLKNVYIVNTTSYNETLITTKKIFFIK